MAQTEEFLFQNVAYRPIVFKTGKFVKIELSECEIVFLFFLQHLSSKWNKCLLRVMEGQYNSEFEMRKWWKVKKMDMERSYFDRGREKYTKHMILYGKKIKCNFLTCSCRFRRPNYLLTWFIGCNIYTYRIFNGKSRVFNL